MQNIFLFTQKTAPTLSRKCGFPLTAIPYDAPSNGYLQDIRLLTRLVSLRKMHTK